MQFSRFFSEVLNSSILILLFACSHDSAELYLLFTLFFFLVEVSGFEPLTSCLQSRRSTSWAIPPQFSELDCRLVKFFTSYFLLSSSYSILWWAILDLNQGPHPYQGCALTTWANSPCFYSYLPRSREFEPEQLVWQFFTSFAFWTDLGLTCERETLIDLCLHFTVRSPSKEVIQPHLPVRLPCYDFTLVTSPAFGIPLRLNG